MTTDAYLIDEAEQTMEKSKPAPFAKPKPKGCGTRFGTGVERLRHPPTSFNISMASSWPTTCGFPN
jgi:hypothetical protein